VDALEAQAYHVDGPSGLLNQSQCEWGAPIFVSQPRCVPQRAAAAQLRRRRPLSGSAGFKLRRWPFCPSRHPACAQ